MKYSLLGKPLWQRDNQFHPQMRDQNDYGLGRYPIRSKGNWMRRKSDYVFKEHRHMHLSNR